MKTDFSIYSTRGLDTMGRNVEFATLNNEQEEAKTHPLFVAVQKERKEYSPLVLKASNTGMSMDENNRLLLTRKHYRRLKKMVDAQAEFPDTEKGKAAVALQNIFKRAGSLYKKKKGDAASSVENLLQEITQPEAMAHITTLGLTVEAEELKTAKAEFDAISIERINVRSELRQTDSASVGRKKLEKALRNYLRFVTSMRDVEGWADLYSDLNELTKLGYQSVHQGKEPEVISE